MFILQPPEGLQLGFRLFQKFCFLSKVKLVISHTLSDSSQQQMINLTVWSPCCWAQAEIRRSSKDAPLTIKQQPHEPSSVWSYKLYIINYLEANTHLYSECVCDAAESEERRQQRGKEQLAYQCVFMSECEIKGEEMKSQWDADHAVAKSLY